MYFKLVEYLGDNNGHVHDEIFFDFKTTFTQLEWF